MKIEELIMISLKKVSQFKIYVLFKKTKIIAKVCLFSVHFAYVVRDEHMMKQPNCDSTKK